MVAQPVFLIASIANVMVAPNSPKALAHASMRPATSEGFNSGSVALQVSDRELADLQVSAIVVPASAKTGSTAGIDWTVSNVGLGADICGHLAATRSGGDGACAVAAQRGQHRVRRLREGLRQRGGVGAGLGVVLGCEWECGAGCGEEEREVSAKKKKKKAEKSQKKVASSSTQSAEPAPPEAPPAQ